MRGGRGQRVTGQGSLPTTRGRGCSDEEVIQSGLHWSDRRDLLIALRHSTDYQSP